MTVLSDTDCCQKESDLNLFDWLLVLQISVHSLLHGLGVQGKNYLSLQGTGLLVTLSELLLDL